VNRVLNSLTQESGRVIGVLGCGGNRDAGKRPLMGKALRNGCDIAIFTSDNPRDEDPGLILKEMTEGIVLDDTAMVIADRLKLLRRQSLVRMREISSWYLEKAMRLVKKLKGRNIPLMIAMSSNARLRHLHDSDFSQ